MHFAPMTVAALAVSGQEAKEAQVVRVAQTPEEIRALLAEIASELPDRPQDPLRYDEQGRALPPWVTHPHIERYSIGWRMGSGEDYWHAFAEWYSSLSEADWSEYRAAYPAPEGWEDFYEIRESGRTSGNETFHG